MHHYHAFGWVLLSVAGFLGVVAYRLHQDAASPRWALIVLVALIVVTVALVINTWLTT